MKQRLTEAVRKHREINNCKAGFLTAAGICLSVALALSAIAATIIVL